MKRIIFSVVALVSMVGLFGIQKSAQALTANPAIISLKDVLNPFEDGSNVDFLQPSYPQFLPSAVNKPTIGNSWKYGPNRRAPASDFMFEYDVLVSQAATLSLPVEQAWNAADYNNQENIGGYEAALFMKKANSEEYYRAMISTTWKEVLLWSSRGGILAVKPFPFEVGKKYKLAMMKKGNQMVVAVNGQPLINIIDKTAAILANQYGYATKEGSASFSNIKVTNLKTTRVNPFPLIVNNPAVHVSNFSLRTWKGIPWGFDGDEPIFALPYGKSFASEVKLVPGYQAQMALSWFIQNWTGDAFRTDSIVSMDTQESGQRLRFVLTTKDEKNRSDLLTKITVTVSYDTTKNVYVYDHDVQLIVPPGSTLETSPNFDIVDPVFLQSIPSATTYGRQWPVAHHWSVYQHNDGKYYKQPLNHWDWYPGYGTPDWWNARMDKMKPDGGSWTLVGDPIANPVLQWTDAPGRDELSGLMCWYAFDLHFNWSPGDGSPITLGPGTYEFHWRATSLPGSEADARLASAEYAFPGDLTKTWLTYTGGVGNVERFNKVVPKASPFGEFIWGEGAYQDSTVGYDDSTSLRLEGPDFVKTTAGGTQFMEEFLPDTDYEVSVWVKTANVTGQGPGIVFSGHPYYPGITGTTGWQRIGFVVRPDDTFSPVPFFLHLSGSGTAWFDNFLIRPITAQNPVTPRLNNAAKSLSTIGSLDPNVWLLLDPSGAAHDGAQTVIDTSGHANNAVRQKVGVVAEAGHQVFYFPGDDAQIMMRGHDQVQLPSPATLVTWVKPGAGHNGGNVVVSGGSWRADRWRVSLNKTDHYFIHADVPGGSIQDLNLTINEGEWIQIALVDDGSSGSLYLNGQLVGSKPLSTPLFGSGADGYVRWGAMSYGGVPFGGMEGEGSQLKIINSALTGSELQDLFAQGPFAE